jgi:glycosyltransferase involved in cell wall biosynthesis
MANGLDAVLDAAIELRRRGDQTIAIELIGDGKLKPGLKQRAELENLTNVSFTEPIPKTTLASRLGDADIGLMILANVPAFYYGTSPNKFFDYLASGLPIICNYPGWVAELIREHGCGIAVGPGNPMAFADALQFLASDPAARRQMGDRARRLADEFDRTRLAERFVSCLEAAQ